jgi:hypothetical protein
MAAYQIDVKKEPVTMRVIERIDSVPGKSRFVPGTLRRPRDAP